MLLTILFKTVHTGNRHGNPHAVAALPKISPLEPINYKKYNSEMCAVLYFVYDELSHYNRNCVNTKLILPIPAALYCQIIQVMIQKCVCTHSIHYW